MTQEKIKTPNTKKLLSPEEKRTTTIQGAVTPAQKAWIEAQAKKCGFKSVSDYVVARCLGYEPKAALTPEEKIYLKDVASVRADCANVVNSLYALTPDERKAHFHNFEFEHEYIRLMDLERQRVKWIFDKLNAPNDFPLNKVPKREANKSGTSTNTFNNKNA